MSTVTNGLLEQSKKHAVVILDKRDSHSIPTCLWWTFVILPGEQRPVFAAIPYISDH